MPSAPLYVLWDEELQEAFHRLAVQEGGVSAAARALGMSERLFYNYRKGMSVGKFGRRDRSTRPRKFLGLVVLERLALALDDPALESREALSHREWCDRGEWSWATNPRVNNRFVARGAV